MYFMCLKKSRKMCFEVKTTAIFNRADTFAYQDYRTLAKKIKLGSTNRRQLLKLRNIKIGVVRFRQVLDVWVKRNRPKRMPRLQPGMKRAIVILSVLPSYSTLEQRTDNAKIS